MRKRNIPGPNSTVGEKLEFSRGFLYKRPACMDAWIAKIQSLTLPQWRAYIDEQNKRYSSWTSWGRQWLNYDYRLAMALVCGFSNEQATWELPEPNYRQWPRRLQYTEMLERICCKVKEIPGMTRYYVSLDRLVLLRSAMGYSSLNITYHALGGGCDPSQYLYANAIKVYQPAILFPLKPYQQNDWRDKHARHR